MRLLNIESSPSGSRSASIGAKYEGVNKEPMNETEAAVWHKIQELAARFQQADRIVLGVPVWNFAYPYKLKQLIDLVCQRNMLFTYDGVEYGFLAKVDRGRGGSHNGGGKHVVAWKRTGGGEHRAR